MNGLDMLVIGIVILSGLLAFARGFVRECLSIVSWLGAAGAALYAMPLLRPYAERYVPKGAIADAVAAGVVFVLVLIALTLITSRISRRVQRSSLSALDRTLGLIFGLMRGALLVAIGFIALGFVLPKSGDRPQWLAQSKTAPLFASATESLVKLLPASFRDRAGQLNPQAGVNSVFENALRAYSIPAQRPGQGAGAGAGPGPSPEDQKRLNQLLQQLDTKSGGVFSAPAPTDHTITVPTPTPQGQ
jgi:membrane protein required for colicin V production